MLQADVLGKIHEVDIGEIFRSMDNQRFYHYKGSLTAPPAIDIVNWFVMARVLPITSQQLINLHNHWHDSVGFTNYRITQPLYGRKVAKNFD